MGLLMCLFTGRLTDVCYPSSILPVSFRRVGEVACSSANVIENVCFLYGGSFLTVTYVFDAQIVKTAQCVFHTRGRIEIEKKMVSKFVFLSICVRRRGPEQHCPTNMKQLWQIVR